MTLDSSPPHANVRLLAKLLCLSLVVMSAPARPRRPKPTPCPGGRFTVAGEPLVAGGTPPDADAVRITGSEVSIDSGCATTAFHRNVTREATIVTARWKTCGDLRKVRLVAHIAGGCNEMMGKFTAKRAPPHHFTATLAPCGDGVVDATIGEECDPAATPTGCLAGRPCSSACMCGPGGPVTTTSSSTLEATTSTTTTATTTSTVVIGSTTTSSTTEPTTSSSTTSSTSTTTSTSTTLSSIPPPDPSTLAPPLTPTAVTAFSDATSFLYEGATRVQEGMTPGAIAPVRVAVLRGRVLDHDGMPLSGVAVRVVDHPELGRTLSRVADGMFDLAVNGGGKVRLGYDLTGYPRAERDVDVPWQDYVMVPDVVLMPLDANVTAITLGAAAMQIARGGAVVDGDGARQATVLVPAGTTADLVLPGGSMTPAATLHLRATEYTVGDMGAMAMPAVLPPSSEYTYAVEWSADEAIAAGASEVRFNQPVIEYVENFLGFPSGTTVPLGILDRDKGAWMPMPNGRVIQVLTTDAGRATVDTDGDGQADDGGALGITEDERAALASLYQPGVLLWRTPLPHFSPCDLNWPSSPLGAQAPAQPAPNHPGGSNVPPGGAPNCGTSGSLITCETQALGEDIPIVGTPYHLHYSSDRVPGRVSDDTIDVSVTGGALPPLLQGVELSVSLAGQEATSLLPAMPNQHVPFTWNHRDGYGRTVQGRQPVHVAIGYRYPSVYTTADASSVSFAQFSSQPGVSVTSSRARRDITVTQHIDDVIGSWDARAQALGGWTLDVLHAYDPVGRRLEMGDGRERNASAIGNTIGAIMGRIGVGCQNPVSPCGDGGPASSAITLSGGGVAAGPDGSVYSAEGWRVRRIGPDGIVTTIAGTGQNGESGDGGPALQATLNYAKSVTVGPDGSVYVSTVDYGGFTHPDHIRRIRPDGVIEAFAGYGSGGDGGPALAASIGIYDANLTFGPDGSLYFPDYVGQRVRRIAPDGIISTVAGNGDNNSYGDAGLATSAALSNPFAVAVAADGTIYVTDHYTVIRKVAPDGIISTLGGDQDCGSSSCGDGGPVANAHFNNPIGLAIARDGSLLVLESAKIRRVGTDGIVTTIAGNGTNGYMQPGDGGLAVDAQFYAVYGIAVAPDGSILLRDEGRMRRITPITPGFSGANQQVIASDDDRELYVVDGQGRHLQTIDAFTGAALLSFTYDGAGRPVGITDVAGRVTTIERDASGAPTAIVAPSGQRTMLTTNVEGWLTQVVAPGGATTHLTPAPDGLLATLVDPNGGTHAFAYDAEGRLVADADPAGGMLTIAHTETASGFSVHMASAGGRTRDFTVEASPTSTHRAATDGGGATADMVGTPGSRTLTLADGSVAHLTLGPDPRFGMQAPITTHLGITTPGGLNVTLDAKRTAVFTQAANPATLQSLTHTVTLNGRVYQSTYSAFTHVTTATTPAGRQISTEIDAAGRVDQGRLGILQPVLLGRDSSGRLATVRQGTRTLTLDYGTDGFLATITDPLQQATSFTSDAAGNVQQWTEPDARMIGFTHDPVGNLLSVTPPGGSPHVFTYTPVDRLATYAPPTVPGTGTTAYTYDLDRHPTHLARPGSSTIDLTYDGASRPVTVAIDRGTYTLAYDGSGAIASVTAPGETLTRTHDLDGALLVSETWSGDVAGNVTRTWNNDLHVASTSVAGRPAVARTYDLDALLTGAGTETLARDPQDGLVTGTTLGVVTTAHAYDSFGDPSEDTASVSAGPVWDVTYARDGLARVTERVETRSGVAVTSDYAYDAAGRLTRVQQDGTPVATYTFDTNGNRITFADGVVGSVAATYDAQDRLLTLGTDTYSYSAAGELASVTHGMAMTTYTYDALGNLVNVVLPGGSQIDYVIDGLNRRVGKKVDGTLVQGFLFDERRRVVAELDGTGAVRSEFVYGSRSYVPDYLIRASDGATFRIVADQLGSPRFVIDAATGVVVQERRYDALGRIAFDSAPGFQPFGFAGGLYDGDTGFTRFGLRDYDARTGRWTAKDPAGFLGADTNLYGYVLGDPVNAIDPEGLFAKEASNFIAGFGDALSLGLTKWIRDMWEEAFQLGPTVSPCYPGYYTAGKAGGTLYGLALGGALAESGAVGEGSRLSELDWEGIARRTANSRGVYRGDIYLGAPR